MKLVFLTVSLVSAFTVEPGPDFQQSIITEQPQSTDFANGPEYSENTLGTEQPLSPDVVPLVPEDSEDTISVTPGPAINSGTGQLNETNSTIFERQWFEHVEEEGQSKSELRASGCKEKLACTVLGGSCVTNAKSCKGRLVPNSCKGKNCQCCVPGCPEGFFMLSASNQCFKFYKDQLRNWTQANTKCQTEGLVLAKPFDAVAVRSYLTERYGGITDGNAYLGARGDGSYIRWLRDSERIYSGSPLWATGHEGTSSKSTTSYCLLLLNRDYWWKKYPTQPFYARTCSSPHWTLCELVME